MLRPRSGGPAPRQHPALTDTERQKLAAELSKVRETWHGGAKARRGEAEKAWQTADAAIKKARAILSDFEDGQILAERAFAAREAELVRVLHRGESDVIADSRSRVATEQARTWNAIADSGARVVNQDTRFVIDKGLQARRRSLSDLGEALETWAETGEGDAALSARFETELARIPTVERIVADAKFVKPLVMVEPPEPQPLRKEVIERTWGGYVRPGHQN